jgi:hypothetical protein
MCMSKLALSALVGTITCGIVARAQAQDAATGVRSLCGGS